MGEYTEFKTFIVTVVGKVTVKADTSTEAITKATEYFIATGKGLDWAAVEQSAIEPKVV